MEAGDAANGNEDDRDKILARCPSLSPTDAMRMASEQPLLVDASRFTGEGWMFPRGQLALVTATLQCAGYRVVFAPLRRRRRVKVRVVRDTLAGSARTPPSPSGNTPPLL